MWPRISVSRRLPPVMMSVAALVVTALNAVHTHRSRTCKRRCAYLERVTQRVVNGPEREKTSTTTSPR